MIDGVISFQASVVMKAVGVITTVEPSVAPFLQRKASTKTARLFFPSRRNAVGPVSPATVPVLHVDTDAQELALLVSCFFLPHWSQETQVQAPCTYGKITTQAGNFVACCTDH
jgi:hypothetical protein